jgi:hypothetical protein
VFAKEFSCLLRICCISIINSLEQSPTWEAYSSSGNKKPLPIVRHDILFLCSGRTDTSFYSELEKYRPRRHNISFIVILIFSHLCLALPKVLFPAVF